jgi:hypothetical protein
VKRVNKENYLFNLYEFQFVTSQLVEIGICSLKQQLVHKYIQGIIISGMGFHKTLLRDDDFIVTGGLKSSVDCHKYI